MVFDTFFNVTKAWQNKKVKIFCFLLVLFCLMVITPVAGDSLQTGDFKITNPTSGDVIDADSSLKIQWSNSKNADGYKIALRDLTTDEKLLNNKDIGNKNYYKINSLEPTHSYRVAICAYGNGLNDNWQECEFSVSAAAHNPEINSLSVTPSEGLTNTDEFTFTVKTNEYVSKVVVKVDGYSIGETTKFKGTSTRTFVVSDITFSSSGINRNVVAYAYSDDGNVATKSTTITVIATEPIGVPRILSPIADSTHYLGDTLSVSWNAPSTNPTDYNIYMYYKGDEIYSKKKHTSTSIKIPASNMNKVGTYSIDVYANKKGYSADEPGHIFISVIEKEKQSSQKPVVQETATPKPTRTQQKPEVQETVTPTPAKTQQNPEVQETVTPTPTKTQQKLEVQETVTPTPTKTQQKPEVQETVTPTPTKTQQKPEVQETVTPTPEKTQQKPEVQETVTPTPSGVINNPLGYMAPKAKINKIDVDIDNGFFGWGQFGKYKVIIKTNKDTKKVLLSIPDRDVNDVIIDTYEDKSFFWFFDKRREFTWEPTSVAQRYLYEGKTYTVTASAYDDNGVIPGTTVSIKVKGIHPDVIGSLL